MRTQLNKITSINTTISAFHQTALLLCLIAALCIADSSHGQLLWSNNGNTSGWDGTVGYSGGFSNSGGKLRMYLPKSTGQPGVNFKEWHRGDQRKYNLGGRNLNGKTIKYSFQLRSDSLTKMNNNNMHCWFFQSMVEANFSGKTEWKPLIAFAYNGVSNRWELNTYSGSMLSPVRRLYSLGGSSADNNDAVNWVIEVKYRTNNTGYVFVWRNGTRILDVRNIPTWFNNATNANINRSHTGWMHYLVKVQGERWRGGVDSVNAYFDNLRVYRIN